MVQEDGGEVHLTTTALGESISAFSSFRSLSALKIKATLTQLPTQRRTDRRCAKLTPCPTLLPARGGGSGWPTGAPACSRTPASAAPPSDCAAEYQSLNESRALRDSAGSSRPTRVEATPPAQLEGFKSTRIKVPVLNWDERLTGGILAPRAFTLEDAGAAKAAVESEGAQKSPRSSRKGFPLITRSDLI